MPSISLPWLDGGKDIHLEAVPLAGSRELQEVAMRGARLEAIRRNLSSAAVANYVLMAAKIRDAKGDEPARQAWNTSMQANGLDMLMWDEAAFSPNLDAWVKTRLFEATGAATLSEAEVALHEKTAEANAEFAKHESDILEHDTDTALVELYWRIYASGAKTLTPRDGDPAPFLRHRDHRIAMRGLLAECASLDDLATIRIAMNKSKRDRPLDDSVFEPTTEEVVRGKSRKAPQRSTPSNGASPASSAPTSARAKKSRRPTARSG